VSTPSGVHGSRAPWIILRSLGGFPGAALLLFAATSIPTPAQTRFALVPWQADPEAAFGAMLASSSFTCATTFSAESVKVYERRIDLTYLPRVDPAVKCAANGGLTGPAFVVPALKPGVYAVYAQALLACQVGPNPCYPPVKAPDFIDSLRVAPGSASEKNQWFIRPRTARSGGRIDLLLLNWSYAGCQNSFTRVTVDRREAIHVDYEVVGLKRLCYYAVRPYGMIIPLDDMKPGRYPVYASENGCNPYIPQCLVASEALVDTLIVGAATSLAPSLRPRSGGVVAAGPGSEAAAPFRGAWWRAPGWLLGIRPRPAD
jgi:hypothetical protein